jgi:hypothetical protein
MGILDGIFDAIDRVFGSAPVNTADYYGVSRDTYSSQCGDFQDMRSNEYGGSQCTPTRHIAITGSQRGRYVEPEVVAQQTYTFTRNLPKLTRHIYDEPTPRPVSQLPMITDDQTHQVITGLFGGVAARRQARK